MGPGPDRREQIVTVSATLFATKGIAATTVREIGETAGVFSGSLYHYFPAKNAIVAEILRRYLDDIHTRFAAVTARTHTPEATVRGLITETLTVIELHPNPTAIYQNDRTYLRDNGLLEPVDRSSRSVREYWLAAIREGVADGSLRADVPAEIFYRSVRDSLWATMHWPIRAEHSKEEFAELLITLFFNGFAAR
ncbi:TetR family transcriptional regulator [Prauserella marina]|uniref:DNA-binding transcriptional regulator, AcrR family n=1 Tax=Prauserella marina TaxID=530584 RepID=A0A222VRD3_9PSEU|nr:TetR/AcrR family transcriptional regulator [Prauserella marina]ASR36281.1 TetR family transcriptional regulator [Prauserella marina]PWV77058.1 TetR family transcriptional regulator [Prauserella marina]SDD03425.1 DNA-binding transcriptional regulator, AcrR family [Prauserella marina]